MGRATVTAFGQAPRYKFQSTPSVGRATSRRFLQFSRFWISIHALRGEGDGPLSGADCPGDISIHALRGEGDGILPNNGEYLEVFQSTPSVGRATVKTSQKFRDILFQSTPSVGRATFNPLDGNGVRNEFQSTPSVGRATDKSAALKKQLAFQSTPSVGRATIAQITRSWTGWNFNPRPPWGGRQNQPGDRRCMAEISIHALRGEGDARALMLVCS